MTTPTLLERLRGRVAMTERHLAVVAPDGAYPDPAAWERARIRLDAYRCCLADAEDPKYVGEAVAAIDAVSAYPKAVANASYGEVPPTQVIDHPIVGRDVVARNGRRAGSRGWVAGKTLDGERWVVSFDDGEKIAYDARDLDDGGPS
jgi:hypothetical protein